MEPSQLQNGDDSWYSGSTAPKQRARRLRKHATEMARAVQALLSLADEIEFEEYAQEEKRRRKDAASGKDMSKEIFKSTSTSESFSNAEKLNDSSNSCKHQ